VTERKGLLGAISRLFRTAPTAQTSTRTPSASAPPRTDAIGRSGDAATVEIAPPRPDGLRISYAPDIDGDPDAGEIVWTWVPYAENDGRGKDRPVLVVGRRDADRVFAVRLTSKSHDGERDFLSIGTGPWDSQGRASWVDVDQLYSVHSDGMRREASALDPERFARVADALRRRYGWSVED
jgi:mRNA-degrading endonuclease toxin of MazEF toxin-antitoxin module